MEFLNILTLQEALKAYELVFDAVYTPRKTQLLQDAAKVGAIVVSGAEMFVRQALGQFRLFTGGPGLNPIPFNFENLVSLDFIVSQLSDHIFFYFFCFNFSTV